MLQAGSTVDELSRRRELLKRTSLWRGAAPAAVDDAARRIRHRTRPAQTLLVAQGEAADALYVIAAGRVRAVLIGDSGRELTLAHLGPGDFFGEHALRPD